MPLQALLLKRLQLIIQISKQPSYFRKFFSALQKEPDLFLFVVDNRLEPSLLLSTIFELLGKLFYLLFAPLYFKFVKHVEFLEAKVNFLTVGLILPLIEKPLACLTQLLHFHVLIHYREQIEGRQL